jgi:hypothetical protein
MCEGMDLKTRILLFMGFLYSVFGWIKYVPFSGVG